MMFSSTTASNPAVIRTKDHPSRSLPLLSLIKSGIISLFSWVKGPKPLTEYSHIFQSHHVDACLFFLNGSVRRTYVRVCIQKFPDWVNNEIYAYSNKQSLWATQRVMAAKFTTITHKIAIQMHLEAESCTICSPRSSRPVRKLLDTLS